MERKIRLKASFLIIFIILIYGYIYFEQLLPTIYTTEKKKILTRRAYENCIYYQGFESCDVCDFWPKKCQ